MPSFTTGDQWSVMIDLGNGYIKVPQMTTFSYQQNLATPSVDAFETGVSTVVVHKNWSGKISFAQTDSTADDLRDAIQAAFQAGTQMANGGIMAQKTNLDNSTTDYQWPEVTWVPGTAVDVSPSKEVGETLSWSAPLRTTS